MIRTIALLDGIWTGHHPTYVKMFARVLLGLGHRVTVFCPQPAEVTQWLNVNCAGAADRFSCYELNDPGFHPLVPGVYRGAVRWRAAAAALGRAAAADEPRPELVVFTHLDTYLATHLSGWLVDQFFPYHWSGLYFSPERLRLPTGRQSRRDGALLSDNCRSVALLDEGVADALAAELNGRAVIPFPDFADLSPPDLEYQLPAQILKKAAGRQIIGLLGCIDKRKGTLTLLDVAERMKDESYFFVFAGVYYPDTFSGAELARIDSFVASHPANCLFSFGFIPDEAAFNALVQACDIIYAAYNNFFHSSNLLTKAAYFRKRIIVRDGFCMAERVRRFRLGEIVNGDALEACINALKAAAARIECLPGAEPDFEGYMRENSLERLHLMLDLLLKQSVPG
jgi:hypothetical protein